MFCKFGNVCRRSTGFQEMMAPDGTNDRTGPIIPTKGPNRKLEGRTTISGASPASEERPWNGAMEGSNGPEARV